MSAYFIIDIKNSCMQKTGLQGAPVFCVLFFHYSSWSVTLSKVEPHESYR